MTSQGVNDVGNVGLVSDGGGLVMSQGLNDVCNVGLVSDGGGLVMSQGLNDVCNVGLVSNGGGLVMSQAPNLSPRLIPLLHCALSPASAEWTGKSNES